MGPAGAARGTVPAPEGALTRGPAVSLVKVNATGGARFLGRFSGAPPGFAFLRSLYLSSHLSLLFHGAGHQPRAQHHLGRRHPPHAQEAEQAPRHGPLRHLDGALAAEPLYGVGVHVAAADRHIPRSARRSRSFPWARCGEAARDCARPAPSGVYVKRAMNKGGAAAEIGLVKVSWMEK